MLNLDIERVNEYFSNLDKKNLLMLYLSMLILFFIIGNLIYSNYIVSEKENLDKQKKEIIKKLSKIRSYKRVISSSKEKYLKQKSLLATLEEDVRYLNSVIYSSNRLYIDNKKYLSILNNYLQIAPLINASFEFNVTKSDVKNYNIYINGNIDVNDYFKFVSFIKELEKADAIVTIDNLALNRDKNIINYDINISIWSIF